MSFKVTKCEELMENENLFSVTSLTACVNQTSVVPGRIKALKIFDESGIATTDFALEYKNGTVSLVKAGQRGADSVNTPEDDKRKVIKFSTTHLKQTDSLFADDFQNVRPFGNKSYEEQVQQFMLDKFAAMVRNNEATIEYQRVGAFAGKILDADGTVILDLHEAFGIEPETDLIDLASGDTKKQIRAIKKKSKEALKVSNVQRWVAFCGSTFFDSIEAAPDVKEALVRTKDAEQLQDDNDSIAFGSVRWEEYDAFVGDTRFIADDEALLVPVVDGLCLTRYAPADYSETVNTVGVPHYAQAEPKRMNRGFDLEGQSNPISIVTVPLAVRRLKLKPAA
ncbi:major capsid protein [Vibrio alginolyticus]|nr:major capsid protein [Vibrio parahaemolyticus]HCH1122372.1 major capsid protein [Vibrio parahaemolyticus]HCH4062836.1 major capsid protein [Vibrio parahaemolyticus]HCH5895028.1 major capsid protein [Vibrio parahaemolyticus]